MSVGDVESTDISVSPHCHLRRELAVLDRFDAVILDDIGYVQQNRDEMEVLFTFLAERYERKSVIITSNLVFSEDDDSRCDRQARSSLCDHRNDWRQCAR